MEWLQPSTAADSDIVDAFSPAVRTWWRQKFAGLSWPQRMAVPAIAAGKHVLVSAPTGTGKTLCAFISILSDLLARAAAGTLPDCVDTLYISPMRALGADIARNLLSPLSEIGELASPPSEVAGQQPAGGVLIRVGQRTGDTLPRDRAAMVKLPPHILITTPESLALCLASPGMRQHLTSVRRIIIDELHSLAPNKRGVDLMLSVERIADLVLRHGGADPQRIGLSATIAPLERIAGYLVGANTDSQTPGLQTQGLRSLGLERSCAIADATFHRPLELDIASVFGKASLRGGATASCTPFLTTAAINRGVYDFLEKTIRQHRTTLVFTNLRSATERVTFALRKRFAAALDKGESSTDNLIHPHHIEAHHSSLDRDVRLDIERRLKAGELRCVVCSTSLELGIDIGTIDRVILLNSPKGVARGLQRIGRSGHRLDGTARGTLVPTVPADLVEAIVTAHAMRNRTLDHLTYPENCLDVLAQHLIGMTLQAVPQGLDPDEAFGVVRRTACFARLPRERFDEIVRYLTVEEHPKLTFDIGDGTRSVPATVENRLHPLRKGLLGLYSQNVGTIMQEAQVKVRILDGEVIGSIEEAFAQILKPGDRFILGGRCVQTHSSKHMTLYVTESNGQSPTVPRWFSGMMPMEAGLAALMREFRTKVRAIAPAGEGVIARMLTRQYRVDQDVAHVAAAYLHAQFRYADIPAEGELLVERVPDDNEGSPLGCPATVLVFHTMIGRAANEALARVVAYRMTQRFAPRNANRDIHLPGGCLPGATVVVDDYAFGVWVESTSAARRADRTLIRSLLGPQNFEEDLITAVEASDLFRAQFRYTAIRAHALLQNTFGRRRFIGQLQSYATRLFEALRDSRPDHFLLSETRRTVMHDILAAPVARQFLENLSSQNLRLLDLPSPSPFSFGLFATGGRGGGGKRDTLQLADTADFLLAMYRQVQQRLERESEPVQADLFSC